MSQLLPKIIHLFQTQIKRVRSVIERKNVYCICCEKASKEFLPFGLVKRNNALCPVCGSLERHRLHWDYMVNQTNLLTNSFPLNILHIAPEKIFYDKFSNNPKFNYTPCAKFGEGYTDTYPEGTINTDITGMEFPDNMFDVIYCSHVLEHVREDVIAMKEFRRVLKPGGWAMLQVPIDPDREVTYEDFSITDPSEREKAFGQYDHVRIYGRDYYRRLQSAGFNVKLEAYQNEFGEEQLKRYGFMKGEDIYICTKN